jgi:hypothetical protein
VFNSFIANDDEWWLPILTAGSRVGVSKYESIESDDHLYVDDPENKIAQVTAFPVDAVKWATLDTPEEIEYERGQLLSFLQHCTDHIGTYCYYNFK